MKNLKIFFSIFGTFLVILAIFLAGDFIERVYRYKQDGRVWHAFEDSILRVKGRLPRPFDRRELTQSGLPVYDLKIAPRQMIYLHRTMDRVQARGSTSGIPDPIYEKAGFLMGGEWIPVDIKLRGLTSNHYHKAYPSIRIKFDQNHLFEGKRQINLVDPYDKFLTADVTTKWEAAQHGIITWDSRFIVLRVNGKVWGLYLEIEQPAKEMIARHDRSEGYILSPHGKLYGRPGPGWEKAARILKLTRNCFNEKPSETNCNWSFVEKYFDTDKLAWAAAIMGLGGHWGPWLSDNIRLYFDPARGKFEPIPWDYGFLGLTEGIQPWDESIGSGPPDNSYTMDGEAVCELGSFLLSIPEFRQMRNERLWILISERITPIIEHSDTLFSSITEALHNDPRQLNSNYAKNLHKEFISTINHNAALLKRLFTKNSLIIKHSHPISSKEEPVEWTFLFVNDGKAEIEISELWMHFNGNPSKNIITKPKRVPGRWRKETGKTYFSLYLPFGVEVEKIVAKNVLSGKSLETYQIKIEESQSIITTENLLQASPFVLKIAGVNISENQIHFGPGTVVLHETIEIPERFTVVFEPGLELQMSSNVSLIIYGDLQSIGTRERPIKISGIDGDPTWGTIAVQGTRMKPSRVNMAHSLIDGGSGGSTDRVDFTASFAVHDGIVDIDNVQLVNGQKRDDGFNFKYSQVRIDGCTILHQPGDAIDLDFCRGEVTNTMIVDCGGDAGLDISGSQMDIDGNQFSRFGDKGVSIGERSHAFIFNNHFSNGFTGAAVKDASTAEIDQAWFSQLQIGVSAYLKKPSFGGGSAILNRVYMENVKTEYLKDPASSLTVGKQS